MGLALHFPGTLYLVGLSRQKLEVFLAVDEVIRPDHIVKMNEIGKAGRSWFWVIGGLFSGQFLVQTLCLFRSYEFHGF